MTARSAKQSDTTITELMIPAYSNLGGKIHGGVLLSLMDKVAFACATKHAGMYCVTVSVDGVDFHQPVEIGDLVTMSARVNYVGNTSLVVGIKVVSENVKNQTVRHTNTSYFTMVAKGDDGKPAQVPTLILEDQTDLRRFGESMIRKQLKQDWKDNMEENKKTLSKEMLLDILKNERCQIAI